MKKPPIKKKWGQNFITDKNLINKIISIFNANKNDTVIEIGPGRGALTFPLSKISKQLIAIEIDPMLCSILKKNRQPNLIINNDDILNYDIDDLSDGYKIIGNLPYYITTPIIFKFLNNLNWSKMTIMVQKEVANRIVAKPGNKNYGRLSIMVQAHSFVTKHFDISNTFFEPKPKVDSTIISIKPKPISIINPNLFYKIVKLAFQKRRKMLKNSLSLYLNNEQLKKYGHLRPEKISVNDFINISVSCLNIKN